MSNGEDQRLTVARMCAVARQLVVETIEYCALHGSCSSAPRRISHLAPSIRWRVMLRCMSSGIGTKPECRRVRSHGGDRGQADQD